MDCKMLLNAIKTLEVNNLDDETLSNIAKSLEMILDMDSFDGTTQEEAFCKLMVIHEAMGVRSGKAVAKEQKEQEAKVKKMRVNFDSILDNDTEELMKRIIHAEEYGTLSFSFRNIRWDWNERTKTWDYTPKKD